MPRIAGNSRHATRAGGLPEDVIPGDVVPRLLLLEYDTIEANLSSWDWHLNRG